MDIVLLLRLLCLFAQVRRNAFPAMDTELLNKQQKAWACTRIQAILGLSEADSDQNVHVWCQSRRVHRGQDTLTFEPDWTSLT